MSEVRQQACRRFWLHQVSLKLARGGDWGGAENFNGRKRLE